MNILLPISFKELLRTSVFSVVTYNLDFRMGLPIIRISCWLCADLKDYGMTVEKEGNTSQPAGQFNDVKGREIAVPTRNSILTGHVVISGHPSSMTAGWRYDEQNHSSLHDADLFLNAWSGKRG